MHYTKHPQISLINTLIREEEFRDKNPIHSINESGFGAFGEVGVIRLGFLKIVARGDALCDLVF